MTTSTCETQTALNEKSFAFEIRNGKKHYLKATIGDIIVSALLPFWGVVIGGVAAASGEQKRGKTMMLIGVAELISIVLLRTA